MPRKKRSRYGDYCEVVNGVLRGRVNIPTGNGKYKTRRKVVQTRTEAKQWAEAQLDRAHHGTPYDLDTFIDLVEWYKRKHLLAPVYEKGKKVEGVKDWERSRRKLDRMAEFFGPKHLSSFNRADLLDYARQRRAKDGVTTATLNRDFALMRAMFREGHDKDSTIKVPKFPINSKAEVERERVMSQDEERRILAQCEAIESLKYTRGGKEIEARHRSNREHLKAVVITAVDTAMRVGEILSLEWSDIDLEAGIITIRAQNTKTQKSRTVGITPRLQAELEKIKGKGKVFPYRSIRKAFATACRNAGIEDLHFHDLRHTATTRMIRAGIPHTEVMKVTGHTQIKTFLRYLNLEANTVKNTADLLAQYLAKEE